MVVVIVGVLMLLLVGCGKIILLMIKIIYKLNGLVVVVKGKFNVKKVYY